QRNQKHKPFVAPSLNQVPGAGNQPRKYADQCEASGLGGGTRALRSGRFRSHSITPFYLVEAGRLTTNPAMTSHAAANPSGTAHSARTALEKCANPAYSIDQVTTVGTAASSRTRRARRAGVLRAKSSASGAPAAAAAYSPAQRAHTGIGRPAM